MFDVVEYRKKYHVANKERLNARSREHYESNREKYIERAKKYRDTNSKRKKEIDREYYKENSEVIKARTKKWSQDNPEAVRARGRRHTADRRAQVRKAFVENVDHYVVFERDRGICQICHLPIGNAKWHIDHVIPLVAGGEHSYRNTQLSHAVCNLQKGAKVSS